MTAEQPQTRVLLARHGRTALNAEARLRGHANPPLDEVGVVEAERLAQALAKLQPDGLRCGPLQRAIETAHLIGEEAGLQPFIDERLNDRDYGPWTGHLKAEVEQQWGSADLAPGVEAVDTVLARAWPLLDDLATRAGVTVLVTHDAVIRPILARIMGESPNRDTRTGAWSDLRFTDGRWAVHALDLRP